jgi:hypothetical protein
MTTTMTFAGAASAAQKKKKTTTRTIAKWSGDCDDESNEYCWRGGDHDEDTVTMTADERRYIDWYHAQSRIQWRDADVASPVAATAAAAATNKTIVSSSSSSS